MNCRSDDAGPGEVLPRCQLHATISTVLVAEAISVNPYLRARLADALTNAVAEALAASEANGGQRPTLHLPELDADEAEAALHAARVLGLHAQPGRLWSELMAELERLAATAPRSRGDR